MLPIREQCFFGGVIVLLWGLQLEGGRVFDRLHEFSKVIMFTHFTQTKFLHSPKF